MDSRMDRLRLYMLGFALVSACVPVRCVTRSYYVCIEELEWNYAPSGRNLIQNLDPTADEFSAVFLQRDASHMGSVYKKAVYKQYTDGTFSTELQKPDWLGLLGPVLRAEVGDHMEVHLKNNASRSYSLHPHGVFYKKNAEGALYPDGTTAEEKLDDAVPPGGSYTYRWEVTEAFAPTESDPSCLSWIYHSHVDAPKDIAAGLLGVLLTCKPGVLDSTNRHADQEHILMFSVVDENISWYLEDNMSKFCPHCGEAIDDPDFQTSNKMHSINGFVFGNLPVVGVCVGRPVNWYVLSVGNEVDVHSVHFQGHTLLHQSHRTDVLSVFPGSALTARMVPVSEGKWILGCQVNHHMQAGMQGFYNVSQCGAKVAATPPPAHERHYYIAAEEVQWDYAPSGVNRWSNEALNASGSDSEEFFTTEGGKLGGRYLKARYVQYTDSTFTTRMKQHGSKHHLGILGPVIKAETGDLLVITFQNKAQFSFSIQPHGLTYSKVYEGTAYHDGTKKGGASVAPGQTFVYKWRVTEGPSPTDPPCLSYLYYSAADPVRDTNSGLIGPLQVCRKRAIDESGWQHFGSEIESEFFLLFTVMDENQSWYLQKNIEMFGNKESDPGDERFQESNKMHSVNGRMYGNLDSLDLCEGAHVVWHTLGLGSEVDLHGIYFHGNTFNHHSNTQDTLRLHPHTSVTVSMVANNDGQFEVSCMTMDHHRGGMRAIYTVKPCTRTSNPRQEVTTFQPDVYVYLAAEEVEWNYAPNRTWEKEKYGDLDHSPGSVFLVNSSERIGSVYRKVVYRQYTDGTFTSRIKRGADEEHLGILGPILRVQVGEKVQVVFKNKASRPYSVHAHGVRTTETQPRPADPGQIMKYNWSISAAPGPSDPKCITFAYYSSVNIYKDLASGLVGPLVICCKGTLDEERRRVDVDQDFALLFMVFDENESWYLNQSIRFYMNREPGTVNTDDEEFLESNMMHGINGKLYANLRGLEMQEGDEADWYLMALGNEVDVHTVHFHAQSFIYQTDSCHRADVYEMIPGTFKTVKMVSGTPGTWHLHCHVTDHVHAGMETTFTIRRRQQPRPSNRNQHRCTSSSSGPCAQSGCSRLSGFHPVLLFFTLIILSFIS